MGPDQVVVLTGPIGSGKSYFVEEFRRRGWQALDADAVGHEVLADSDVIASIQKRWPSAVSGSTVDRAQLASLVFTDGDQLSELESLTHTRIRQKISDWIATTAGRKVIEASVPGAIAEEWGKSIVVDATRSVRHARLVRRGMSEADITLRMKRQPERSHWLALANIVIDNDMDGRAAVPHLIDYLESC